MTASEDKRIKSHADKNNKFIERDQKIPFGLRDLILCKDADDVAVISHSNTKSIDDNEGGATADNFKAKTLQGRWFNKHKCDYIHLNLNLI